MLLQLKQPSWLTSCHTATTATTTTIKSHKMQSLPYAEVNCECNSAKVQPKRNKKRQRCNMLATPATPSATTIATAAADSCGCCCQAGTRSSRGRLCRRRRLNINSFNRILTIGLALFVVALCDITHAALSDVNLIIEPPAVRRGQSVVLHCHYNLQEAPLYSVKFYRGQLEFFRYTPGEHPNTKVFHYPGIIVDESLSNATQVVIRNVIFGLSGNFSCEVTADAPLFSTATAYAHMQVVEFLEKRPQLFTENTRYEPGDVLRANCSTSPSRPRAELRFTINNMPVSSGETQYIRTVDNLIASRLSLKLQLQGVHFAAGSNSHVMNALGGGGSVGVPYNTAGAAGGGGGMPTGGLVLRCTAQIGNLYQEYKEIELGTPQKDPVPARVTLSSGSSLRNFFDIFATSSSPSSLRPSSRWHAELLTVVLAAFHWLQLCRCR